MCKLILEQVSLKWLHLPFLLGARQGSEKQDSFRFDWGSTCQDHIKQMEEVKTKQDLLIDSMNEDIKRLTERKAQWDSWNCLCEVTQVFVPGSYGSSLMLHHVIHLDIWYWYQKTWFFYSRNHARKWASHGLENVLSLLVSGKVNFWRWWLLWCILC